MSPSIDIDDASGSEDVPDPPSLRRWVTAALSETDARHDAEVSVRIVDEAEMVELNGRFRRRAYPTNVLSFPAQLPEELDLPLLGDIVVCAPVVAREAGEQDKPPEAHWAHMLVHGTLHLLGYDHEHDDQALVMESLETRILTTMGYPPPYRDDSEQPRSALQP